MIKLEHEGKNGFRNLYYTVGANFITLAISVLLNLFVPKLLGVREYSYWQLYVFYSSYVGFAFRMDRWYLFKNWR